MTSSTTRMLLSVAVALVCVSVPPLLLSSNGFLMLFGKSNMAIKNVIVAGGFGTLGAPVVEELVKAGYTVSILSRSSDRAAPEGVSAVKVADYSNIDSLRSALLGQDAVVSTIGSLGIADQSLLVDAAVSQGVKRFIPSEFGINTRKAQGTAIGKIIAGKIKVVDYLTEKANASSGTFTWTGVSTGLFFDVGLDDGLLGFDRSKKVATIHDSGNEKAQYSTLHYIGKSVAAILGQASAHFGTEGDKTANKYIEVASFTPSQNDILKIVEAASAAKWEIEPVKTSDLQKEGEAKLARGDFSAFVDLLRVWQFQDGAGHAPDKATSGNSLLGLEEENLEEILKAWVASGSS